MIGDLLLGSEGGGKLGGGHREREERVGELELEVARSEPVLGASHNSCEGRFEGGGNGMKGAAA